MRIRQTDKDFEAQVQIESIGRTIVNGIVIATDGILEPFVKDITEYRTELDEDGNEIQVEVGDDPILPTYDGNTIPQIKEFMIENDIPYTYLDSKLDLIEKIIIFYDNL